MKRAHEQLHEEVTYRQLATFLRSGGTLEVGDNFSHGAFARIRKGGKTILVANAGYRDFAAVLKEMDMRAGFFLDQEAER